MSNKKTYLIALILLLAHQNIQGKVIGSDSIAGKFDTQQTLNDGDRIGFFASLGGGFKINSADNTATFDSIFPVSGTLELGLGTLTLLQDLILHDTSELKTIGNINGNNHILKLAPSITSFPTSMPQGSVGNPTTLKTSKNQSNSVTTVDWSYNSQYVAIGLDDNGSDNKILKIYAFDGISLTLKKEDALDQLKEITSVRWHPSKHLLAVARKKLSGSIKELLILSFNPNTFALTEISGIEFSANVYAIAWHPSGNYLAVGAKQSTKEIAIYAVDSNGIINQTPVETINLDPTRYVYYEALDWNSAGNLLAVGTLKKTPYSELLIYTFESEILTLNAEKYFNDKVSAVGWNKTYTDYLAVGLNGAADELQLYKHDKQAGSLTKKFENNSFVTVRNISWSPNGKYLGVGKVKSSTSYEKEFEIHEFDIANETLVKKDGFDFANEVEAVRYSPSGKYVAIGTDTRLLNVYLARQEKITTPESDVIFDNLDLILNAKTTIENCQITMNGNCSINGKNHILTLCPTATLIIGNNATLHLKNITLSGIENNHFYCTDNTSSLVFNNVKIMLSDDYNFTTGTFNVKNKLEICGPGHTFSFKGSTKNYIEQHGTIILKRDLTFNYAPQIASNNLLEFADKTAKMTLQGATLHATTAGLHLTKGTLEVGKRSYLASDATTVNEAIIFGDGANNQNNMTIQIQPGANLEICSTGIALNKNV